MAKLDSYLGSLKQFKADAVVLGSGKNITLRFAQGDKSAKQQTSHEQIVAMVQEVAPPAQWAMLRQGQAVRFTHRSQHGNFAVDIEPNGTTWMLTAQDVATAPPMPEQGLATGTPPHGTQPSQLEGLETNAPPGTPPMPNTPATPASQQAPAASAQPQVEALAEPEDMAVIRDDYYPQASMLDRLLRHMKASDASDLHLTSGCEPMMRQSGSMLRIHGIGTLSPDRLLEELMAIAPEENRQEFDSDNDTDFAYEILGVSRFRVNVFRDRMGPGAVLRTIPFEMPSADVLGIPKEVLKLCNLTKGLVLVTGPTGSGKSTTLAALIDYINSNREDHIITIEDPLEFIHPHKKCLVNQREIRTHTQSFKRALRAALREDPDIVLVGEMRDLETIEIAVETAETGHLVFGTLHTTTAPGTVDRIIDQFPADRQAQIRMMLSESLMGVISQVLCKKVGGGRTAAYEILIGSSAVSNLIREKKTFQLYSLMQTGKKQGMQTMNMSLSNLVKEGVITADEAYMKAVNKQEMVQELKRLGAELTIQT